MDRYNFDALDGMKRLRAVDELTMMVGEVRGPGLIRQNLIASLVETVMNLLTGEHDVSGVPHFRDV